MGQNAKAADIRNNSITTGVIWKELLIFFFPLLFGTFFQTLYNTVDAMIVGHYVGKEGLSAVGGASAMIVNLLVGFFVGVSSGVTVVTAQFYGAGRDKDVEKSVHTTMALAILSGILLTAVCFLLAPIVLTWMNTPKDTMADSVVYLQIFAFGMIPNMVYNMGSGVLRGAGDAKHPTYYLIAGALTNIVLDLFFIVNLHLGVAGAALATIISQAVSAVLTVLLMMRTKESYHLVLRRIRIERDYMVRILKIGVPAGFRSSMYSISNMVIQTAVNGFGTNAVAAWAAWGKIDAFYWMIMSSLGSATTTFVGQNYGAGLYKRVRRCGRQAMVLAVAATVFFIGLAYPFMKVLLGIFTTDRNVLHIGSVMGRYMMHWYITYIGIEVFADILIGMSDALIPTLITIFGVCVLRIAWNLIAVPRWHMIGTVMASYPITWTVTSLLFCGYYFYYIRKHQIR